ncbi:MAG TPA: AMP-binding protein [Acetobacteraceae bacterium]|nr:AMP-binding protein [Acetobacteraceae bacterium]
MSTLPDLLRRRMATDGAHIILRRKDRGIWKPVRWAELGATIRGLARALHADGFGPGMVGAVLADTSPEWVFADLALQAAGGLSAGLSPIAGAGEIAAQLRETAASVLFVENEEQLDKALAARATCPALRRIVIFDMKGLRELDDPMCAGLAAFVERGAAAPDMWDATIDALDPDAPAALVYSEGNTGPARPVRLSHRHLATVIEAAARLFDPRAGDERLAVMPMAHVSERVLGLYLALHTGCISNYGESTGTLEENLREVKPTVLLAAPWLWKRFRDRIVLAAGAATWTQRMLFRAAFAVSAAAAGYRAGGRHPAPWTAAAALLARPMLANVRRELGLSRLRLGLIGGGMVAPELVLWFMALGIDPIEVYGPAESAGLAAAAAPGAVRPGDAGCPIAPDELRISAEGEIELSRTKVCPAAPEDPALGAEAWHRTGDVGVLTEGRITVLGGLADMITPPAGTPVHPEPIERALCLSPYIADALVVGDGRPFLGCLLRLDSEAVEGWAHAAHVPFASFADLAQAETLHAVLGAEVARVNAGVARASPIRAFRAIDRRLQYGDAELTPLGALRRGLATSVFRELIEAMYGKAACQAPHPTKADAS